MFNKEQITTVYLQFLEDCRILFPGLDLAKEIVLGAGGAMVMMGLRETTSGLDLDVPAHIFDIFALTNTVVAISGYRLISVNDYVDIHPASAAGAVAAVRLMFPPVTDSNGVTYTSAGETLALKRSLNREKDLADITKLQEACSWLNIHTS